jgi:hypothetical protein
MRKFNLADEILDIVDHAEDENERIVLMNTFYNLNSVSYPCSDMKKSKTNVTSPTYSQWLHTTSNMEVNNTFSVNTSSSVTSMSSMYSCSELDDMIINGTTSRSSSNSDIDETCTNSESISTVSTNSDSGLSYYKDIDNIEVTNVIDNVDLLFTRPVEFYRQSTLTDENECNLSVFITKSTMTTNICDSMTNVIQLSGTSLNNYKNLTKKRSSSENILCHNQMSMSSNTITAISMCHSYTNTTSNINNNPFYLKSNSNKKRVRFGNVSCNIVECDVMSENNNILL